MPLGASAGDLAELSALLKATKAAVSKLTEQVERLMRALDDMRTEMRREVARPMQAAKDGVESEPEAVSWDEEVRAARSCAGCARLGAASALERASGPLDALARAAESMRRPRHRIIMSSAIAARDLDGDIRRASATVRADATMHAVQQAASFTAATGMPPNVLLGGSARYGGPAPPLLHAVGGELATEIAEALRAGNASQAAAAGAAGAPGGFGNSPAIGAAAAALAGQ
jgi:hypothetical protein